MKLNEPNYRLLHMGEHEWRFEVSAERNEVDIAFGELLEQHDGGTSLTSKLRKFVNLHPDHIDALHHYAMCKLDDGKPLDAYAFAHAAVAVGRRVFPLEFSPHRDQLSGGWLENRPFLRALHGLMLAEDAVGNRTAAIAIGRELLGYDPEDRMGARLALPDMLLADNRNAEALDVFSAPGLENTFGPTHYLRALALLRLGRDTEARQCLQTCLADYPQIARFMLDPLLPEPTDGNSWGIVVGSPFEGWYYSMRFSHLWRKVESALPLLRDLAAPIAAAGWPGRFSKQ